MNRTAGRLGVIRYLLAVLGPLCALASCDWYLVSICYFEQQPDCYPESDGSSMPIPRYDGGQSSPTGPERIFTRNATISLINRRFVGMNDTTPLILSMNPKQFESYIVNFDTAIATLGPICTNCPQIPTALDFIEDRIYKNNEQFYFFDYKTSGFDEKLFKMNGNMINEITGIKLTDSCTVRPFAHPLLNFMMTESKPKTVGNFNTSTLLNGVLNHDNETKGVAAPTAFVIGDLDSNDLTQNGFEFITFGGSDPIDLFHFKPGMISFQSDKDLLNALAREVNSTNGGDVSKILAAYITDLNSDGIPDFIYARSGKVFVTSYIGHIAGVPQFKKWSMPVIEITGQTIQSIMAIEMTKNSYPELIIETDADLQFFVNDPKL